jgi:4-amino-4-deoxy-L-arabinose transferase-like glycosyltransferase
MVESGVDSKKTRWFITCGVLALGAISASWMLSAMTLESHECFVSVTAREVLESGDWVLPTFNGQPRINKTPLSYWLVAGLAKITGKVDEFAARAPSALFAFLSAAAVLYFVNRWISFRVAAISTGVWVTSLSYIRCSHSARPDMALAFFTTVCLMSFYSAVTARTRKNQVIYMLVFWVSFGLGNLAKGPAPVVYVFVPILAYIVILRQWKIIRQLLPVAGLIITTVIMLPWPLAIVHRMNWDLVVWKREFFDRLFGGYEAGHYRIYYYLGMMFKYITPWVAFLPMALAAPFYRRWEEKQPVMKFLWLWFVTILVFLTIDAGKRQHYILPLMPAMAVLIGILLDDMAFVRKAYTQRFAGNVLKGHVITIIVGVVSMCVYLAVTRSQFLVDAVVISIVAILITLIVAILFSKGKPTAACGVIFSGIVAWIMIFYAGFSTELDADRPARDFAMKIACIVPPSDKLVAYKGVSSIFVQYFGKVVPEIQDKSLLYERYEQGDWTVCVFDHLNELAQDGQLREVYCSKRVKRKINNIFGRLYYPARIKSGKEDTGGALFHKSAAVIEDEGNSNLEEKPILPEHQ